LAGEVIGGSLAPIAASFVMNSSELDLFAVLSPVRRGLFRGRIAGLEIVSLGFGEEGGCRAAAEVGEGADVRLVTTSSPSRCGQSFSYPYASTWDSVEGLSFLRLRRSKFKSIVKLPLMSASICSFSWPDTKMWSAICPRLTLPV
jgi:hypothetical protein